MASKKKTESWVDTLDRVGRNGTHLDALVAAEATPNPKVVAHQIVIPRMETPFFDLKIVGDSPLICHNWSDKAKKQMRDRQLGNANAGREKKNPEADFRSSLYPFPGGGYGFPTIAFKKAAVSACTSLDTISHAAAKQAFHIMGVLTRIEGEPVMREDMVNVGKTKKDADLRYRAEFDPWSTIIRIRYNLRVLSAEQVVNLFNIAGFAVGVGEWRPQKDGSNGLFHVEMP